MKNQNLKVGDKVASKGRSDWLLGTVVSVMKAQGVAMVDTYGVCGMAPVPFQLEKLAAYKPE